MLLVLLWLFAYGAHFFSIVFVSNQQNDFFDFVFQKVYGFLHLSFFCLIHQILSDHNEFFSNFVFFLFKLFNLKFSLRLFVKSLDNFTQLTLNIWNGSVVKWFTTFFLKWKELNFDLRNFWVDFIVSLFHKVNFFWWNDWFFLDFINKEIANTSHD